MSDKKYLSNKFLLFAFGFMVLILAPQFLKVIYPSIELFNTVATRPYWYLYLILLTGIGVITEKRIFKHSSKFKEHD